MGCSLPHSSVNGISHQKYWSELSFPSPGALPNPGVKPISNCISCTIGRFFYRWATREALCHLLKCSCWTIYSLKYIKLSLKMYHINSYLVSSQYTGSFWLKQQARQPDGLCLLRCPWLYTGDPHPGGSWDDRGRNRVHSCWERSWMWCLNKPIGRRIMSHPHVNCFLLE